MAKKRMISNQIVDSDDFLDMSLSSQALYLHLLVRADDEGFINGVKKIMRMIGTRDDDLKVLVAKNFILPFESGVVVIKHWLIHNAIRQDRIIPTAHIDEKVLISVKENKSYTLKNTLLKEEMLNVSHMSDKCPHSIGLGLDSGLDLDLDIDSKDSYIEEEHNDNTTITQRKKGNIPYKEIIDYLNKFKDGRNFSYSESNKKYIRARWKDINGPLLEEFNGNKLDIFKKVIENSAASWKGTNMEKYLRPSTIFNGKFEDRLDITYFMNNTFNNNKLNQNKHFTDAKHSDEIVEDCEESPF